MSETTNLKLFKHDNPSTNENQFDVTKALNNNWDKIDDFAETTNTKITENQNNIKSLQTDNTTNKQDIATLKSDNTTNKQDIANLKTENEELKAENERLRQDMNAYPSNEASGEYITLNDSADSRFNKFKVLGKSTQATRNGKNKFNINMVSISTATDKVFITSSFSVTDKWSQVLIYNENLIKMLEPNKNYKMIADVTLLEKTSDVSSGYNNANLLTLYDGTNTITVLKTSTTTEKNNWTINEKKHLITEFTTPADLTGYGMRCYCYYTNNAGAGKFKYDNVMILDATEEDETFEMYGVSPSPEFKSDIQNVTADVEMTICNNNLTNTDILALVNAPCVKINSKNSFSVDLSKGYVTMLQNIDLFLGKNDKNKVYKLSYHLQQNNNSFRPYLIIRYSDGTNTSSPNNGTNTEMDVTLTSSEGKTIEQIGFGWGTQSAGGIATLSDIYLRQVDDNSEFQEQEKQEFVFPLSEGQRLYEGSYLADDGIHHKRKQRKMVLSEFNISVLYEDEGICSLMNKSGFSWDYININGMCSHFKNAKNTNIVDNFSAKTYLNDNEFNFRNASNGKDRLYFKNSAFTTLEQWRDFFNNNEVIVEYECNEYVEAYTDEQKQVYDELVKTAKSYKTVTNIFSTNEISPKFEVNYRRDIDTYIDNKLANVNEQILNIAGGN